MEEMQDKLDGRIATLGYLNSAQRIYHALPENHPTRKLIDRVVRLTDRDAVEPLLESLDDTCSDFKEQVMRVWGIEG
ncbi:MAG: hypothetical protein Q8O95_01630 [bacterium]|nr:hypothetical protein [bacterium]